MNKQKIKRAAQVLKDNMSDIDSYIENWNQKFATLMTKEHDDLGRILKSHLIIEHYLNHYLSAHYVIEDIEQLRLSFSQKLKLLPDNQNVIFVKKGIDRINKIRNRFSHTLDATICNGELNEIDSVLMYSRPEIVQLRPVERIEHFTVIACGYLSSAPEKIQDIFSEANKHLFD
ncbi:hypothetical protein [Photobacterium damselae]|uniref:hypothetical protein n=1 Tax=Photobacterium damselae TaxID=38293 RepID=UPI002542F3E5|nr:hypothetical protein [Photobacterium damselae]WIH21628.1 hypothetical protein KQY33_16480 [Photobacterium damselae]